MVTRLETARSPDGVVDAQPQSRQSRREIATAPLWCGVMSHANKQVVRRMYDEVSSQGALDVIDEVVSANLLRAAFPDVHFKVNDMVSIKGFDLIRVDDGICTEHWGVFDNGTLMEQLGAGRPS